MNAEAAGIKLDESGCILVDSYLRAGTPHIFAAGDVKFGPQFTHVAAYDGEVSGYNATVKKMIRADYSVIPRGTFCRPEVSSVGLTEHEARSSGQWTVGIGKAFFAGFGRALMSGSGEGVVKVVVDLKSGRILGAGIVGDDAAELIHELALAIQVGATYHEVGAMMHAYPTGSEVVKMACLQVQ